MFRIRLQTCYSMCSLRGGSSSWVVSSIVMATQTSSWRISELQEEASCSNRANQNWQEKYLLLLQRYSIEFRYIPAKGTFYQSVRPQTYSSCVMFQKNQLLHTKSKMRSSQLQVMLSITIKILLLSIYLFIIEFMLLPKRLSTARTVSVSLKLNHRLWRTMFTTLCRPLMLWGTISQQMASNSLNRRLACMKLKMLLSAYISMSLQCLSTGSLIYTRHKFLPCYIWVWQASQQYSTKINAIDQNLCLNLSPSSENTIQLSICKLLLTVVESMGRMCSRVVELSTCMQVVYVWLRCYRLGDCMISLRLLRLYYQMCCLRI